MRSTKLRYSPQGGFTLVELLIVIVIIGILAGVVIGTLNPLQQQNRARDATVRAQIDKMALSAKGLYVSSPRTSYRSPTPSEFMGGLGSATAAGASSANCTDNTADGTSRTCTFSIAGQTLPADCGANSYTGTGGSTQCQFVYTRNGTDMIIAARGAATPVTEFVYYYSENATTGAVAEGFYSCPTTYVVANGNPGSVSGCTLVN